MGVLGFVGGKLVAEYFGVEVSTMMSLAVVFSTLGAGIGASILLKPEDDPTETRKSLKDTYAKNSQDNEERAPTQPSRASRCGRRSPVPSIASLTRAKAMSQHDRTHTHVILQSFCLSQDLCCTFAAANTRHPTA